MSRETRRTHRDVVDVPPEGQSSGAVPRGKREITSVRDIEDIISPIQLRMISEASGGFRFILDRTMSPADTIGMTDMRTRCIRFNAHRIAELSPERIRGLATHEAGHHAPPVKSLDDKLVATLGERGIIPDRTAKDAETKAEIAEAINAHAANAILDCFLEAYMGRGVHYINREAIDALNNGISEKGPRTFLRDLPKAEQLCQLLVGEDRYPPPPGTSIRDLVDPDVYASYRRVKESGAIATIQNVKQWTNYFANELGQEAAIERKRAAFRDVILPEWLKLFEAEIKKRKEEKEKRRSGEKKELTPEEIKEIMKQLAQELKKLGEQYKSKMPSPDEGKELDKVLAKIREGKSIKTKDSPTDPGELIRTSAEKIGREWGESKGRGMAENLGIRIESVRTWEEIKKDRKQEIKETAAAYIEIFVDDRRKRLEYLKREGVVTPGMEYDYVSGVIHGELDRPVHEKMVQNPEFIEVEIEFVQDCSGSMSGEPIRQCVELDVILGEAARLAHDELAGQQLLSSNEENPMRIGVTKFETTAERVKKLEEPMTDEIEMKIVDELTKGGGGTDEEQALTEVYGELKLHDKNILKIIVIQTDGEGNRGAVQRIMQEIEDDDEVIVAVVGYGSSAAAVIDAYLGAIKRPNNGNIFAINAENPSTARPQILEFFKARVRERRR